MNRHEKRKLEAQQRKCKHSFRRYKDSPHLYNCIKCIKPFAVGDNPTQVIVGEGI